MKLAGNTPTTTETKTFLAPQSFILLFTRLYHLNCGAFERLFKKALRESVKMIHYLEKL